LLCLKQKAVAKLMQLLDFKVARMKIELLTSGL